MRINKFLAQQLNISRRSADAYIEQKNVRVNKELASLGFEVGFDDLVEVNINGKKQVFKQVDETKIVTILFYKPIFCITSKSDPDGRKTIYSFLPKKYHHLNSAGRLDYLSEGLLVLSNDGDLIYSLTHPKNNTKKMYIVGVSKPLSNTDIKQFKDGIVIDNYNLNPVEVNTLSNKDLLKYSYLNLNPKASWYFFELTEGRNNQIRKMISTTGQKVQRLIRVGHGDYKLSEDLKNNKFIEV